MDTITSKLQYIRGLVKGLEIKGEKINPILDEIINVLELINDEYVKIYTSSNLNTVNDSSCVHNSDVFSDATVHKLGSDVWLDKSVLSQNQPLNPIYSSNKNVLERICKHCGTYFKVQMNESEVFKVKIQCPKCKHFILPKQDELQNSLDDDFIDGFEKFDSSDVLTIQDIKKQESFNNSPNDAETKNSCNSNFEKVSDTSTIYQDINIVEAELSLPNEVDAGEMDFQSKDFLDESRADNNETSEFDLERTVLDIEDEILFNDFDESKDFSQANLDFISNESESVEVTDNEITENEATDIKVTTTDVESLDTYSEADEVEVHNTDIETSDVEFNFNNRSDFTFASSEDTSDDSVDDDSYEDDENVSYDTVDDVSYAGSEDISHDSVDDVFYAGSEDISHDAVDDVSYEGSEDISDDAADDVSYEGSEDISHDAVDDVFYAGSEEVSNDSYNDISDASTGNIEQGNSIIDWNLPFEDNNLNVVNMNEQKIGKNENEDDFSHQEYDEFGNKNTSFDISNNHLEENGDDGGRVDDFIKDDIDSLDSNNKQQDTIISKSTIDKFNFLDYAKNMFTKDGND